MIYAVTDRNPEYLKAIYPAPVEIVNTRDEIPGGCGFIEWSGCFCAYHMMRRPRIAYPLGRFASLKAALAAARR